MVEYELPKLGVAGSSPVARSTDFPAELDGCSEGTRRQADVHVPF